METYNKLRKNIANEIDLRETELLEVGEMMTLYYQQYEGILDDLNVCSSEMARIKEKQEWMKTKKINKLRLIEMLSIVLLDVLTLGFVGNDVLPALICLCGEAIGTGLGILGLLAVFVLGVIGVLKLDGFMCAKIIKKMESKREYKHLISEELKCSKIIEFKSKEKDKKFNEYTRLVDEEKGIKEKIRNDRNMIELLDSLIEEDRKMDDLEICDSKLVRKRIKDEN